jgi:histidine triad (HIT) family protein
MCIFCKIVNKEIAASIVLENDDFLAFRDINPQAKVHILVIPKVHMDSFNDLDSTTASKVVPFIQEVVELDGIKESGYRVITNINSDGGQEVSHLHFHILGGEKLKGF